MALAGLIDHSQIEQDAILGQWSPKLVDHLIDHLRTHPAEYNDWLAAMYPIRNLARPELEVVFRDPARSDSARSLAATILAHYLVDDPRALVDLLIDATPGQFSVILAQLLSRSEIAIPLLDRVVNSPRNLASSPDRSAELSSQAANAAIGLLHLGQPDSVWNLLDHSSDPLPRTYLIDRLSKLAPDPAQLRERLDIEQRVAVRRALLLVLGGINTEERSPSWFDPAARRVSQLYRDDADPGIHSAAEWVMRQWHLHEPVSAPTATGQQDAKQWYLAHNDHTMALIHGPVSFWMGRGDQETGGDRDEARHECLIPRSYWLCTKEVSTKQYLAFRREVKDRYPDWNSSRYLNLVSPDPLGPVNVVLWLDAVAYCRWLSETEGIPEDQMCYPKLSEIKLGMKPLPDFLSRSGYRLPTEAEWEYAARAAAPTSRFFGNDAAMLPRYAWFIKNSDGRCWPGGMLLPNDFGLFDILGNVREWCCDLYQEVRKPGPDLVDTLPVEPKPNRIARGGSYPDNASVVRVANRFYTDPTFQSYSTGFRIARTHPKTNPTTTPKP